VAAIKPLLACNIVQAWEWGRDKHPVDQAILANSITLTPGTLALDVHDGEIIVHALTRAGADELERGEMDRRVAALRVE